MAVDSRCKKLGNHISIHTQEVREKEQQVGKGYHASKPTPVIHFFQKECAFYRGSITSANNIPNGDKPCVQIHKLVYGEHFSIKTLF